MNSETAAALSLLSAEAIRDRAHRLLAIGLDDRLPHFSVRMDSLQSVADLVIEVTRSSYPTLDVPFHSRWRHFAIDGQDRWLAIARASQWKDRAARARAEFDLAIVSVLLDAGAGPNWYFLDPQAGRRIGRSEGLAIASLSMFAQGAFSSDPHDPLRADAGALMNLSEDALARGLQATSDRPLVGIETRAQLLRSLGRTVAAATGIFAKADRPRPGGLFDHLAAQSKGGEIAAPRILSNILHNFGPIWPSRLSLGGVSLGDCWRHPMMARADSTDQLVPLHKLSQWLTYSLIEPMQRAGVVVGDIDGLTGLAEYRNGGLFVDGGVLSARDPNAAAGVHDVASIFIVEWRALTVALLDRVADIVRKRLSLDAGSFPLPKVLQGGTWAAGRRLAREKRADGGLPFQVRSDGTVF